MVYVREGSLELLGDLSGWVNEGFSRGERDKRGDTYLAHPSRVATE